MSPLVLASFAFCLFVVSCTSTGPRSPATETAKRDPHWGASYDQVLSANCRQRLPKNPQGLKAYFANLEKQYLANSDGNRTQLFDLVLIDQPGILVQSLHALLSPGSTFNKDVVQISNPKQRFQIPDSCTNVACAAEAIFGPVVGLQMLFIKAEFDLNSSPYSYEDADLFTEDELWDIIFALELIPKNQHPFSFNQKLTHYKRGLPSENVLANATIGFFDRWTSKDRPLRQYVAFHEFAHKFASNFVDTIPYVDKWLSQSGWQPTAENQNVFRLGSQSHPSSFISGYGKTNPSEDFAESVTAYRLNPFELKSTSPGKYEFIREYVFDGIEFTHSEACERKPFHQEKFESGKITANDFPQTTLNILARTCQPEYAAYMFGHLPRSYFENCVQTEGIRRYFTLVENRPVPRSLVNQQFKIAKIKIPQLEPKIIQVLNKTLARQIWNTLSHGGAVRAVSPKCDVVPWTTLNDTLIQTEGISFVRKPLAMDAYSVSPVKVQRFCQDINFKSLQAGGIFNQTLIHAHLNSMK